MDHDNLNIDRHYADEVKMRQNRWNLLSILVGALLTISAALIPYAIKYVSPDYRFEYDVFGPIVAAHNTVLRFNISNNGEKIEQDVRVFLKFDAVRANQDKNEKNPYAGIPILQVSSTSKADIREEGDGYIIAFGDLRSKDKISASVILRGDFPYIASKYIHDQLQVKSKDRVAENISKGNDEFIDFMYPFGFWLFAVFFVVMMVYSIYYEYFMNPEKKEKLILDAINKLKK